MLVGHADGGRVAELAELAERHGVADRVWSPGELDAERLAAIFRSADVVVSLGDDGGASAACAAAMACGAPVVATTGNGMADLVVDGVSGLLLPARDVDHVAEVVRGLVTDGPRRDAYGIVAADRAAACFSWDRVVTTAERAYRRAVSNGRFVGKSVAGSFTEA